MPLDIRMTDDGLVAITQGADTRTFTLSRFQEIVATLGTYYKEILSPMVELGFPMQYECLYNNPPVAENGSYLFDSDCCWLWPAPCRRQLFQFVAEHGLFAITLADRTTDGVDVAAITARWILELGLEACRAAYAAVKQSDALVASTDLTDTDARRTLALAIRDTCPSSASTPSLCNWIFRTAATEFGVYEDQREKQCRLCVGHDQCHTPGGSRLLCLQLQATLINPGSTIETLEGIRLQAVASFPTFDALFTEVLGL